MLHWLRNLFRSKPRADSAGERGERLAAEWLGREAGFVVIVRNWRNPRDRRDEIDLVCRDGDVLVFVEVKARAAGALVPGYHAIDERKKRVLRRTIKAYLAGLHEKPRTFRFDVLEIATATTGDPDSNAASPTASRPNGERESAVLHFENVPLFSKHFRS